MLESDKSAPGERRVRCATGRDMQYALENKTVTIPNGRRILIGVRDSYNVYMTG